MKLTHYIEVTVRSDSESCAPDALSMAINAAHRANAKRPFAISFPDMKDNLTGSRLRVFSDSKDHLSDLLAYWKSRGIAEGLRLGAPQEIPAHDAVEYFKHFRTKSQNKKFHPGKKPSDEYFELQFQRLKKMPYIKVSSNSSKQNFRSYILRIAEIGPEMTLGLPNSYGLSSTRNMVAIPVF